MVIEDGRMVLKSMVICKQAFWSIHGFSNLQIYKYEKIYKDGCKVGFHGNTGLPKPHGNTLTTRAILEITLKQSAKPMPHVVYNGSNGTDAIEYRLPSSFTKTSIFEEVNTKMGMENLPTIAYATFHRI